MNDYIAEVTDVSMRFDLHKRRVDNLKEYFIRMLKNDLQKESFWALRNISFKIKKGESLGIVGTNGSGKSTLLKIIAGVMKPTEGSAVVHGRIAPLIELGAGFDPELSAAENIHLYGSVLGFSRKQINERFDNIVSFSELEEFIDVPIKNFSTGMHSRLGFSIATSINPPDILIMDEVLSVGDFKFQQKCRDRVESIINSGTTVLFVSHSNDNIMKMCKKALWLNKGAAVMYGDTDEVCEAYANS